MQNLVLANIIQAKIAGNIPAEFNNCHLKAYKNLALYENSLLAIKICHASGPPLQSAVGILRQETHQVVLPVAANVQIFMHNLTAASVLMVLLKLPLDAVRLVIIDICKAQFFMFSQEWLQ